MKKTLLVILGLALTVVAVSCDGAPPPPPPKDAAPKVAPPKPAKPAPPAPAQQPQGGWKPGQQTKPVTDGVTQTLDYGASVGRAYNNSKQKIKDINQQHNRELEDALNQ